MLHDTFVCIQSRYIILHTYTHTHQSVSVQVLFSPRLDSQAVKAEALQLAREDQFKQTEEAARMEREKLEMDQQQQVVVSTSNCVHVLYVVCKLKQFLG